MSGNTPWIILAGLALAAFAVFEIRGYFTGRNNTLTQALRELSQKWPLTIFLAGAFTGALAMHLWG